MHFAVSETESINKDIKAVLINKDIKAVLMWRLKNYFCCSKENKQNNKQSGSH